MSNVKIAQDSLQAELAHARQGLVYYQSRVEALTRTLEQLNAVENVSSPAIDDRAALTKAKTQRKVQTRAARESNKLPSTGTEFWMRFITEEKRSNVQILQAAIASLGFEPSAMQMKKLKQRMGFALHHLSTTQQIQDEGAGRARLFFKKAE